MAKQKTDNEAVWLAEHPGCTAEDYRAMRWTCMGAAALMIKYEKPADWKPTISDELWNWVSKLDMENWILWFLLAGTLEYRPDDPRGPVACTEESEKYLKEWMRLKSTTIRRRRR